MMEIIIQVLAAAVGTIAFSVLFSVPKRYYGFCGICGGAGWLVYALLVPSLSVPVATFFATVLVIFLLCQKYMTSGLTAGGVKG